MRGDTAASRALPRLPALSHVFSLVLPVLLFAPVFVQLTGEVFRDPATLQVPGAGLTRLPIPLALPAIYIGLLAFRVEQRKLRSWRFVLVAPLVMLLSSAIAGGGAISGEKLKLLTYFLLPIPALLVGEAYASNGRALTVVARSTVWILAVLMPTQLALTWWMHDRVVLSPDAFLFSVYDHQQYVPVILVAGYLLALFVLWPRPPTARDPDPDAPFLSGERLLLLAISPVVGCYAAASMSLSSMIGAAAGSSAFALHAAWLRRDRRALLVPVLGMLGLVWYFVYALNVSPAFQEKFQPGYQRPDTEVAETGGGPQSPVKDITPLPLHVAERVAYWQIFSSATLNSIGGFLWGHARQIDPKLASSAHNYYLDLLYNFGLVALLPLVWLIVRTARTAWQGRRGLLRSPPLLGLAVVMLFLLVMDNGMRVSLRIPYSGAVTFFLWGALLAGLGEPSAETSAPDQRVR